MSSKLKKSLLAYPKEVLANELMKLRSEEGLLKKVLAFFKERGYFLFIFEEDKKNPESLPAFHIRGKSEDIAKIAVTLLCMVKDETKVRKDALISFVVDNIPNDPEEEDVGGKPLLISPPGKPN